MWYWIDGIVHNGDDSKLNRTDKTETDFQDGMWQFIF